MRWNYYKLRQLSLLQRAMDCYYKLRHLFYYKVRHGLLQIATGITKCYDYYKLRQYKVLLVLPSSAAAERAFSLLSAALVLLKSNRKLINLLYQTLTYVDISSSPSQAFPMLGELLST